MKTKTWFHVLLHVGCIALLLFQGHRIQELRRSEVKHHQTALQVRQLFFGCTSVLGKLNPGLETEPDLHDAYWKIVGPYPNW